MEPDNRVYSHAGGTAGGGTCRSVGVAGEGGGGPSTKETINYEQMSPLLADKFEEINNRVSNVMKGFNNCVDLNMLHNEMQIRESWQHGCEGMLNLIRSRLCELEKEKPDNSVLLHEKISRIGILECQVNTLYKIIDDLIACLHKQQQMNENVNVGIYPTNPQCQL